MTIRPFLRYVCLSVCVSIPFTALHAEVSCHEEALAAGKNQQGLLSSLERSFVHPGVYTSASELSIQEWAQVNKDLAVLLSFTSSRSLKEKIDFTYKFNSATGAYCTDGDCGLFDRIDRKNHNSVLRDFERLLLQRPIREWNPQEVIGTLLKISKPINDQEILGIENDNNGKFRNGNLIIRRGGGDDGIFFYPSAMREELKNQPEHLKLYEGLGQKTKKLAISYGEKPIEPEGKDFKVYWDHHISDILSKDGPSQGMYLGTPLYAFVNTYYRLIDSTPREIQQQMVGLIQEVKRLFAENPPIATAAYIHQRFVDIHPFADANGRVARLLMNVVLRQGGLPSVAFFSDAAYTRVVSRSLTENNISLFEEYLSHTVCKVTSLRQDKEFQNGQVITDLVTSCAEQMKTKRAAETFNDLFSSCKKQFDTLVQRYLLKDASLPQREGDL